MDSNAVQLLAAYAAGEMQRAASAPAPLCKVCNGRSRLLDVVDFGRQCNLKTYPDGLVGIGVYFHRCADCGLVFSEFFDRFTEDQWRTHVYNDDYGRIDPEYSGSRSARNARMVRSVARSFWMASDRGCDFGGGQGATARLLSSQGFRFDSVDPFGVDTRDDENARFRLVTAFEVLEHSPTPVETFERIANLCSRDRALILASTSLVPAGMSSGGLSSWWYAAPRNGHITLHTERSLGLLAATHELTYRRVARGLHLFGRGVDLSKASKAVVLSKILERIPFKTA